MNQHLLNARFALKTAKTELMMVELERGMDAEFISSELALVEQDLGMKTAKGAMGKIRSHAKKYGEKAFDAVLSDLDDLVDGSREWNEMQKGLFRSTALEAFKTRLERELR